MGIFYRKQGHFLVVFGQTYPVKETIKALGGRFDGSTKTWRLPHEPKTLEELDLLCRQWGGGPSEPEDEGSGGEKRAAEPVSSLLPTWDQSPDLRTSETSGPTGLVSRPTSGLQDLEVLQPVRSSSAVGTLEGRGVRSGPPGGFAVESALTVRELLDRAARVVTAAFSDSFWIVGEIQNMSLKQSAVFFDLAEARDQGVYSGGGEDGGLGFGDEGTHGGSGEGSRLESPGRRESSIPAKPRPTRGRPMKPGSIGGTLTIRCVLWQEALRRIRLVHGEDACEGALQDGLKVALRCRVQFYRDRAQLSLVVEDLDPSYTKGALALMREKLLKELRAKGLDRANGSLEFPDFPFVVGLISAEGSRAYSDFTHQLEVLGFPGHVVFCPSPMQGDGVPQGVCRALELLVQRGCDVIVVTRGGGSAADLRWFDDRDIAYAIAQCSIPVIAAIGHHDDRCVAEEVCYQRQKTPTAAADFLMAVFQGALSRIDEAHRQLLRGLTRRREGFVQETARLGEKMGRLVGRALEARSQWLADRKNSMERLLLGSVAQAQTYGSQLEAKIAMAVERRLSLEHQQIGRIREQIVKADPRPWLAQGWTQLQDLSGRSLRSVAAAHQGQMVRARLLDGVLKMEIVERIEIDSEDQGQGTLR